VTSFRAHIFKQRSRGEREEVVLRLFNADGSDFIGGAAAVKGSAFLSATIPSYSGPDEEAIIDIPWQQNPTWAAPNVSTEAGRLKITTPGVYRVDGNVIISPGPQTGSVPEILSNSLNGGYDYGYYAYPYSTPPNNIAFGFKGYVALTEDDIPALLYVARIFMQAGNGPNSLSAGRAYCMVDRVQDFADDGSYTY
jgi:hypothetical protein